MKRWTASLLALCLALSLAACGGDAAPRQSQGVDADVDLTQLSSTLVYAEVYNMASNPQSYVGKTVRMKGNLVYQVVNGQPNPDYMACLISDATACCAQGVEFVLAQPPAQYPDPAGTGGAAIKSMRKRRCGGKATTDKEVMVSCRAAWQMAMLSCFFFAVQWSACPRPASVPRRSSR